MPSAETPTIDLVGHLEDLRREAEEAVEEMHTPEEAKTLDDPRDKERWTFQFRYMDARGKEWVGQFTDKILSIKDRQTVGILQAKLCGGMPFVTLPPEINELNKQLAHMAVSLVDRPAWAKDLTTVADFRIVEALWLKVVEHESTFFRLSPDPEDGPGADFGEGEP